MSLARDWARQLCGAWGAALLAPATMIAALAVLALGGGFGGLGALGQLVSGPAVPVGSPAPARVSLRAGSSLLPVVPAAAPTPRAPALATSPVVTHVSGSGNGGSGNGGSHGGGGGGGAQGIGTTGQGVAPPAPPPPARTPTQPTAPVTTPTQPPASGPVTGLVNNALAAGEAVTSQLPAPVAAVGTGVLQSIGQTLNRLLPSL